MLYVSQQRTKPSRHMSHATMKSILHRSMFCRTLGMHMSKRAGRQAGAAGAVAGEPRAPPLRLLEHQRHAWWGSTQHVQSLSALHT